MSSTVDNRVVEMRFDNKQFESNVQTSIGTLGKLKQSLNLSGAAKGLENVDVASKKLNFNTLSNAVDTVRLRFSALETMAVTALANITNSAVNAGKRMVAAFTIDPIKTGLAEYETQINSVQTILANTESKGTTLTDVNAALDELNTYADKTIYNFTEMTRNIGTFTAAGVDLETSVSAIKGIANLAAVSGSNSQQASTAMYQLSQALASGTVKLMDWNSVVNAGMGGQVFQDALKETARVHGVAIDEMITKQGSFRETLSEGWLSSDILLETLSKFTGDLNADQLKSMGYTEEQIKGILQLGQTANDAATKVKTFTQLVDTLKESAQSGWTQTWETVFGDFGEAKSMWTVVSETLGEVINKSSESRNALLSAALDSPWKKLTTALNASQISIEDYEKQVTATAKTHGIDMSELIKKHGSFEKAVRSGAVGADILKEALGDVSVSGDEAAVKLDKVAGTLKRGDTSEGVKQVEEALKSLGYTLTGVTDGKNYSSDGYFGTLTEEAIKDFQKLNGLKVTGMVDEETLAALEKATTKTKTLAGEVEGLDEIIGSLTEKGGRELLMESFGNIWKGLTSIIAPVREAFRDVFPPVTAEQLYKFIEGFHDLTAKFALSEDQAAKLKSTFKGLFSALDIGVTFVKDVISGIGRLLGNFAGIGDKVLTFTGSVGDGVTKLRDYIKNTDFFGGAIDKVVSFLQKGIDAVKKFGASLREKISMPSFDGFLSLMQGIGNIVTAVATGIKNIASAIATTLGKALKSGAIGAGLDAFNTGLVGAVLWGLKDFVGGLGDAFDDISGSFGGIKEVLNSVKGCLEAWQQDIQANTLLKIAVAIGILAASLFVLSTIDPGKLVLSLGAVSVLFKVLMGSLRTFSQFAGSFKGVTGATTAMLGMSFAILILASALKSIGSLSWEELAKGLVGVFGLMTMLVAVAKVLSSGKKTFMTSTASLIPMALALTILAATLKIIATMSWEELGRGVAGLLATTGILVAAMTLISKFGSSGKMMSAAASMIVMTVPLTILAGVLKLIATMNWNELGRGVAGLLATMGILVAALVVISNIDSAADETASASGKMLAATGAMIGMALSLTILAGTLKIVASMNWEELARGLTGVFVVMGILVAALAILSTLDATGGKMAGVAGSLLLMSAAILVLTPAMMALGSMSLGSIVKGLVALAGAFTIIGVAGLVLSPLVPVILALGAAFALVGIGILALGAGLTLVAAGFVALAAAVSAGTAGLVAGLTIIITGIADLIPVVVQRIGEAIVVFCEAIANSSGAIAKAVTAVVMAIIDILVECTPALANGLGELIVGLLDSLTNYLPKIIDSLFNLLLSAINGVTARVPELIKAGVDLLMAFFTGIVDALSGFDTTVLAKGLAGIGIFAAIMAGLSALGSLAVSALAGVLGMAAVIAALTVLLVAIGGLAQIPGLVWIVGEGGDLLMQVGNAIGGFVGGIIGGVAEGVTASLPGIGTNLSSFITNIQPFLDGLSGLDASILENAGKLAGAILAVTAADLISGVTSWLTGDADMSTFGTQLVAFGTAMKEFSTEVSGVDVDAISTAAEAGTALTTLANSIPNTGGLVSFFAGDNDMATFGAQFKAFGTALKDFSAEVTGIDVTAIATAAEAGASLTTLANSIPNTGGLVSFFTGDNDMATFGTQFKAFGTALKDFSTEVNGIDVTAITTAADAGTALTTLANSIPNTGGLVSFFAGDNDMATFGTQFKAFGTALKDFSTEVVGLDVTSLTAAADAGTALTTLANSIPNTGGLVSFFTGDNDMETFGTQIVSFGTSIKSFGDEVKGIDVEAITAAATAATALATLTESIPNSGGIISWFTGDNDLETFGTQIKSFGSGIKGFADEVAGIDASAVTSATTVAESFGTLATSLPEGDFINRVKWLGDKLKGLGTGLKGFSDETTGIDTSAAINAVMLVKSIGRMASDLPEGEAIDNVKSLANKLKGFGTGISDFADEVASINSGTFSAVVSEINSLSGMLANLSDADFSGASSFKKALSDLSSTSIDDFVKSFDNAKTRVSGAAESMLDTFAKGVRTHTSTVTKSVSTMTDSAIKAARKAYNSFYSAGKYMVDGFAKGISANTFKAAARAAEMAKAAVEAAKEELDEHSPSRVAYGIGAFFGEGFINALNDYESKTYRAGGDMAESARLGLGKAIARVQDTIDNGLDGQPTIRPVLDLTDVQAGTTAMGRMLGMTPSVGVMANVNSINSMMSRNQNGGNRDVVSAIEDLGRNLENKSGNTYQFGSITYGSDSAIAEAVALLVNAAKMEGRS